jgi:hypothetical protein
LSIPKDWDSTWFRKFIANSLKGADVRNAIGANGITITGNISSPYATISLGGGPITLQPGAGGTITLTIDGAANNYSESIIGSNTTGQSYGEIITAGTNASDVSFLVRSASLVPYFEVRGDGKILGDGPTAGVLVDMTPDRGTFTLTHTGFTTGVTSTATWYRIGNIVILNTGTGSGTSNATTWTATGVPAAIQPTLTQTIIIGDVVDNGAGTAATVGLSSGSGTLTFGKGFVNGGAFTNSGAKGFNNTGGTTFVYILG